jgi:hypothetical protein
MSFSGADFISFEKGCPPNDDYRFFPQGPKLQLQYFVSEYKNLSFVDIDVELIC